jgi:hypothetical protein
MTKRGFASYVAVVTVLLSRLALAQPESAPSDSPQWLKDRRYNEGIGIRAGDIDLHPGIAGEFGYDSNVFLRSSEVGTAVANGVSNVPLVHALAFRVTPSLYFSTRGAPRGEGEGAGEAIPPSVMFHAGVNATYHALIGLGSGTSGSNNPNNPAQEDGVTGGADARLDILPGRSLGGSLFAGITRAIEPNTTTADPDLSFNRDAIRAGAEIALQPGGGTLDWHVGYEFDGTIFETSEGAPYDTTTNQATMRGRWKFRPRTALLYDASLQFIQYSDDTRALAAGGLVNSQPLRARLGLSGLVTDRFALTLMAGYGASFLDTSDLPGQKQYDSVIGQAELKWYLSASPGISNATDIGLALSSVAIGYTRDFSLSYLGNYNGQDRGYLKFSYFFAGRMLATLEGGVSADEYPDVVLGTGQVAPGSTHCGGVAARVCAFTDTVADATLFSEYRFTDEVGLNLTLRYSQTFSNENIPEVGFAAPTYYAMSWQRFEAYLGLRWFM